VGQSQSEIEIKWCAKKISRGEFNKFVWSSIGNVAHRGWSFKNAGGPDYYFMNSLGYVARHRDSDDCKELTVKARMSANDITERIEINVPLDLETATTKCVHGFLRYSGYKKLVTITKDCDIYLFIMKNSPVHATVVWYEVKSKGHETKTFIEVEVDNGTRKERLKALKYWQKILEKKLKLTKKDISKSSLYEIYTEKRYRMAV
jgi:adenylate cyclase class IV